jgi:predicted RND superfamily exporter protein
MQRSVGFGAERIGLAAIAFPKTAALLLAALLILIGFSLPRLTFDDDIHRVFLSDSTLSQAQRSYDAAQDPPTSTILIHITSPASFTAETMGNMRDLALDLEFTQGVTAVASPFVLRLPLRADAPNGTPLFAPEIDPGFADDLARFDALGTGLPTFLSPDLTAMLLGVTVDTNATEVPTAARQISDLLATALPQNLTARITGEDVISSEIVSGLKADLISLNLWGALVVTLAAALLLRDLRMALLAVVPALIGAAGVMALCVWLGYPVTVLSNVIPILLLVLGVANGVHLAGHLKHHGSVRDAVTTVGPACALTALTTSAAFAGILLTGNEQLFEFAVLGALGTLLAFVIVLVAFCLMARVIRLSPRPLPRLTGAVATGLATQGARHPRSTLAACCGLLIVSVAGFVLTTPWFPLYQNLPDNSPTLATNDAISAAFGGVFRMIVESGADWPETVDLVTQLEAASGPQSVLSEVSVARWLGHPDTRPSVQELAILPTALAGSLRTDDDATRIFIAMPEPMRSAEVLARFDTLYNIATQAGADRVIGLPVVMRIEAVRLIGQLSAGLIVAALGATALCALAFRSFRLVPVLILPNILPITLTGASLHLWAQGALTPTAVLALTIAFGIAIDDTVHFLSRFALARKAGQLPEQAIVTAAKAAGEVMVLTTLLLSAGLCVTLLSDFYPIRLFGGMMIVTLWTALLIDLLLLPALLTSKRISHAVL